MGGFVIRPCVLHKVLLLVSVIVCSIVAARARASVVNIGALLSFDSAIGKVAKVAIQAAVEDVNRDQSLLPETRLHLTMQDTNYSGFLGLVEGLILMERETVAIIGPEFSVTAHIISHVVNELRVPLLSYAATDPTLSSLQNPFFVRTTHSDLFQMAAISDLVEYYGWRDVIAIYADDEHGRNAVAALGDKLAEKRCRISYKAPLSSEVNQTDIANVLVKVALMESRILVLVAYPGWGLELLHMAQYLGMMNAGYVWIVNDWLSTLLDTNSPLPSGVTDDMQGVLTLRMYTPVSEQKTKFASGWRKLIVEKGAHGSFGLNAYGLCAYDTVWLLAHALDAFFNQGGNISFSHDPKLSNEIHQRGNLHPEAMSIFDGGKLLLQSILQMNITGLTGPIKFDEDRNLVHPAYEVINVIGTGFRRVGFWSKYSGLSVVRPETLYATPPNRSSQQLYSVLWPGQPTQKPLGWVFPNDGRHLKIGVPNSVIFKEFESVESNDTFKGYCIDLFTAALNLLPYAVPYKFDAFGDGHTNPEKTELLELMAAGVYDAVVGDIAITTNRTRMADFTQPYIESGLVVVAPVRRKNSSAWSFLRPFTPMMWCVTGLFFLFMGVVVWILEHRINDDFRGPPDRQIVTMLWFSFSTLFFAHKKPLGGLGRLVLIVWLFVVFLLNSSYTASLTSILTVEQLSSTIKGIESLVSSNEPIGYQRGSFTQSYLAEEYNIDKSRLIPLNSEEEYAKALRDGPSRGGVVAVIDQRAYMELFLSTRCEFSIVGQEFSKIGWGFAFPRDSPLAVDMSTAILKLSENGDLERIHDKWLQRSACTSEGTKQEAERLQLKSFWGLFVICALACLLALLLHLIKIVQQFGKLYSADTESLGSSSTFERLQTFLSFVDEKEEESKSRSKRRRTERMSNRSIDGDESMTSSFKSTNSAGSSAAQTV